MNDFELARIHELIDRVVDGSEESLSAIRVLRETLGDRLPEYLLQKYSTEKKASVRATLVYQATRYSRHSPSAFALGLAAVKDKSKVVRHEACLLLAWSQNWNAIPVLKLLADDSEYPSRDDAKAAIDALEQQNPNYFVDREHSGLITLNIR